MALTSKISAWQFMREIVVQRTQIKQFIEIYLQILNAWLVNLSSWMILVTIPLYLHNFIVRISVSSPLLDLCFVFILFFYSICLFFPFSMLNGFHVWIEIIFVLWFTCTNKRQRTQKISNSYLSHTLCVANDFVCIFAHILHIVCKNSSCINMK